MQVHILRTGLVSGYRFVVIILHSAACGYGIYTYLSLTLPRLPANGGHKATNPPTSYLGKVASPLPSTY